MLNIDIHYKQNNICTVEISGAFDKNNIKDIYSSIKKLKQNEVSSIEINCLELTSLDNSGAVVLVDIISFFSQKKVSVTVKNLDSSLQSILIFTRKNLRQKPKVEKNKDSSIVIFANRIGKIATMG